MERYKEIERSIITTYRSRLWSKFMRAIKEYELIKENDRICVCISGGKDSMVLAKLFQELKRHSDVYFEVEYMVMNPGYNQKNLDKIKENLEILNIDAKIFETDIFEIAAMQTKSPCYLCAKMRRGALYNFAKELGCNKIALGHHYDDVIETIVMGMLYGAQIQTMMPKVHSENFEGMELMRPLYLIREKDIKHWRDYNGLEFLQCACKFTEGVKEEKIGSTRLKVKKLIESLKKEDPQIEANIFKSVENVNLSTIIAYKDKEGNRHHFKDEY